MPIPQIETASGARCVSSAAISFGVSDFESCSQTKMRSKNSSVFSRFAAAAVVRCCRRRRVVTAGLRDVNKSFVRPVYAADSAAVMITTTMMMMAHAALTEYTAY